MASVPAVVQDLAAELTALGWVSDLTAAAPGRSPRRHWLGCGR